MTTSNSMIVAGARTPIGRLQGSLKDFSGSDLGGIASKGALERSGVAPEQVEYVIMGQVLTGCRANSGSSGRGRRRYSDERSDADDQQGVSVRHQRHRHGRPAYPRGRVRRHGGRWPGIDEPGSAHARKEPAGFNHGDVTLRDHMAFDGARVLGAPDAVTEAHELFLAVEDALDQCARIAGAFGLLDHRQIQRVNATPQLGSGESVAKVGRPDMSDEMKDEL